MKMAKFLGIAVLALFLGAGNCFSSVESKQLKFFRYPVSTVDHSKLKELNRDFKSVEEVTRACLSCHNKAGEQFKKTLHWTWQIDSGGRKLGKRNIINNF